MKVLLVVESLFGNTAAIGEAIAAGLRDGGAEVDLAPAAEGRAPAGYDLVVVGAPTHNMGLPTPTSRASAQAQGAAAPASGVAEWLAALPRVPGQRFAAFDTAVASAFSGSAAKRIEQRLRRLGAVPVARESFTVAGSPPQLAAGVTARAEAWGAGLTASSVR